MTARTNFPGKRRSQESGYVLLTLLLIIALMIIFTAAVVPSISFDIKRDREEEMIHRGVQYSRAIRGYYKKFGRYPTKLEDLESANNLRFLRKRYKDPITGQDFKLLHFGEVKMTFGGGIAGAVMPGTNAVNTGGLNGTVSMPQATPFGANNSFGVNAANPSSPYGQNAQGNNPQANPAGSDSSPQDASQGNAGQPGAGGSDSPNKPSDNKDPLSGQTFGGGPIVGVASTSKKETIREFNHKKKYNEWQFIYDPGTDRGGLLMTPNQPQLQGFGQQNIPGMNGPPNSGFGPAQSPAGMQSNPNQPASGTFGTPGQPNNPPQPQQQ